MKAIILDCDNDLYKETEISSIKFYLKVLQRNPNVIVSVHTEEKFPDKILDHSFMYNILEAKFVAIMNGIPIYKLEEEI